MPQLPSTIHKTLAAGQADRQVVDLILPIGVTAPVPLLVFIHGGAWVSESTKAYLGLARYLAEHGGIAVALPEYRLTMYKPESQPNTVWHPDHLSDVFAGLQLIFRREIALQHGYTTEGAVLVGHSAGGFMTLAVALDSFARGHTLGSVRANPSLDERIRSSIKAFVCVVSVGAYVVVPAEAEADDGSTQESIFSLVQLLEHYPTYSYFTTPAFYPPGAKPEPSYAELGTIGPESWPLHAPGTYFGKASKPTIHVIHSREDSLLGTAYNQTGVDLLQAKGVDLQIDLDTCHGDHEDLLHEQTFWQRLISIVRE